MLKIIDLDHLIILMTLFCSYVILCENNIKRTAFGIEIRDTINHFDLAKFSNIILIINIKSETIMVSTSIVFNIELLSYSRSLNLS